MTRQRDIIEVVKELLVMDATTFRPSTSSPLERQEHWHFFERKLQHHFADIAQALLTKDEQLRIAREALERAAKFNEETKGCEKCNDAYGQFKANNAADALSRISSL